MTNKTIQYAYFHFFLKKTREKGSVSITNIKSDQITKQINMYIDCWLDGWLVYFNNVHTHFFPYFFVFYPCCNFW